jgi:hypothetical protein
VTIVGGQPTHFFLTLLLTLSISRGITRLLAQYTGVFTNESMAEPDVTSELLPEVAEHL